MSEVRYKIVYVRHSQVVLFDGQSHDTNVTKRFKRYQVNNEETLAVKKCSFEHGYKVFKKLSSVGAYSIKQIAINCYLDLSTKLQLNNRIKNENNYLTLSPF